MRFTVQQYERVRQQYESGQSIGAIAAAFGVRTTTITRILARQQVTMRDWRNMFNDEQESAIVTAYTEGMSLNALSQQYGVCYTPIRRVLEKHGVVVRPKGNSYREFSDSEIETIRQLAEQGQSQYVIARQLSSSQITISRVMRQHDIATAWERKRGKRHSWYKEGRIVVGGYVRVLVPIDHEFAVMRDRQGYVPEHRLVMAEQLGRPLTAREDVHHIDGNHENNDPSNLQLRHLKHGKGVVYRCRHCGSYDVVEEPIAD